MRPIVLPPGKLIPSRLEFFLPSFVMRKKPPEGSKTNTNTVIERWAPERGNTLHFIKE